jgi:hypothetical protein
MQLPAVSYIEHRQIEHRAALIYAGLPKSNGFVRPPSKTRLGNIVIGFLRACKSTERSFVLGLFLRSLKPKAQATASTIIATISQNTISTAPLHHRGCQRVISGLTHE